jgi:hypothetical protein
MKRLILALTTIAILAVTSCAGSKDGTGNGCKGTKGFIGYGRK